MFVCGGVEVVRLSSSFSSDGLASSSIVGSAKVTRFCCRSISVVSASSLIDGSAGSVRISCLFLFFLFLCPGAGGAGIVPSGCGPASSRLIRLNGCHCCSVPVAGVVRAG